MAERLTTIDAHDAVFLLRCCYAIPKLTYFLRSAPTFRTMATLQEYDQVIKNCLEDIINIKLDQEAWTQSSLPIKQGGLGIRKATDLALSAFLSSAFSSSHGASALLPGDIKMENYIEVQEALDLWKAQFSEDQEQDLPEDVTVQTLWDQPVFELRYQELLDNQSVPTEKARLMAAHSEHSSCWLTAVPASKLGLKMDDRSLQIAVGLYLGVPLCHPYKCGSCGLLVDTTARHGLSCIKAKGTRPRHDKINDILLRAMGAARHTSAPEPQGLCSDDSKQPDGITLFSWKHGMRLVWDVTCPDTFAPSYLHLSSKGAGKAAEKAEKEKIHKYQELSNKFIVMPVAVETMGAWGRSSLKFVQDIGERMTMASGDKQATFKLLQNISMEIQRGNISSILGTLPTPKSFNQLYYL